MRILFTALCLEKAGSHVVALTLASGMAKRHEVYFFNQGEQLIDQGMVNLYLDPAVKLIDMTSFPRLNWMGWKINGLLTKVFGYRGFHEWLKTHVMAYVIKSCNIDLVHGHEIMTRTARLTKLARRLPTPIVVTDHNGYSMLRKVGDDSFIPYANLARAIIAVSCYTADIFRYGNAAEDTAQLRALGTQILAADHGAEYESLRQAAATAAVPLTVPVSVIYNGVQRQQGELPVSAVVRAQLGVSSDTFVIGMAGRGTEQKGWRIALTAYQQLKQQFPKRKFAWLCMGEGPCLQEIKAELGTNNPDIYLLGSVDNPHYYMAACQVGLVPSSFSEGLPLCITEFYEHGVPVIASDLCGIPEVIVPTYHAPGGLLIEMDDALVPRVVSLLGHLVTYVTQPNLREEHGRAAREIRRRFDIEPFVEAHEQLYEQVLSGQLVCPDDI
jgi:glycosyltransferase involved in cell wall biosynthesis